MCTVNSRCVFVYIAVSLPFDNDSNPTNSTFSDCLKISSTYHFAAFLDNASTPWKFNCLPLNIYHPDQAQDEKFAALEGATEKRRSFSDMNPTWNWVGVCLFVFCTDHG